MQKQKQVYPSSEVPRMELRAEGIPLRWFNEWATTCLAHIPKEEQESAVVHGYDSLRVVYVHTPTEVERLMDARLLLEEKLREIKGLLGTLGQPSPEELARIRELLK